MSRFDPSQPQNGQTLFSGGEGGSFVDAVLINTASPSKGIDAEYEFISARCGVERRDWQLRVQRQEWCESVPYDILTVVLPGGSTRDFYFNISRFFGGLPSSPPPDRPELTAPHAAVAGQEAPGPVCQNCGQAQDPRTGGHAPSCSCVTPKGLRPKSVCDCGRSEWPVCFECGMIVEPKCKLCLDVGYYEIRDYIMEWIWHEEFPPIQMPCVCWNGAPPRDPEKFLVTIPEERTKEYYEQHGMDYLSLREKLEELLKYHQFDGTVPNSTLRELLDQDPGANLPTVRSSDFSEADFVGELTARRLLDALTADDIAIPRAETEIESLNKLLRAGSFHRRFSGVSLSQEAKRLIGRLPRGKEEELRRLNRLILEAAYPLLCPKHQDK